MFDKDKQVKERRAKVDFTHFLSIPVATPTLMDNYERLKTEILTKKFRNVNKHSFMHPS